MIRFYYEDTLFRIKNPEATAEVVKSVSTDLGLAGLVEVVFCSDRFIEQINAQYLNHFYPTDIITFSAGVDFTSPMMYISVDTVLENAKIHQTIFLNELFRVVVHGLLHLAGYNDLTKEEKTNMRKMENQYLYKYFQLFHVEQLTGNEKLP